jgi:type IV secretory pathway TrbD component
MAVAAREPSDLEPRAVRLSTRLLRSRRVRYALAHLAISAAIAAAVIALVLLVWYPAPLARLDGVYWIVALIIAVDVLIGPLLTAIVASESKPRPVLWRDLAVIATVQVAALTYGLHAAYSARPAYVVFNADRFDTVATSEVALSTDGKAAAVAGSWWAPRWVHALPPADLAERNRLLFNAVLGGHDLKHYADLYQRWPADRAAIRSRLRDLNELQLDEAQRARLDAALARHNLAAHQVAYVPLMGRQRDGVVLLDRTELAIIEALDLPPNYQTLGKP